MQSGRRLTATVNWATGNDSAFVPCSRLLRRLFVIGTAGSQSGQSLFIMHHPERKYLVSVDSGFVWGS